MPKSPEKPKDYAPVVPEPTVELSPTSESDATPAVPETSADPRDTAAPVPEGTPDVKVVLSENYKNLIEALPGEHEGVGDGVFVQVSSLPEDLADDNDRFEVPTTPTPVPAAVAAQLVESPAVEVVD